MRLTAVAGGGLTLLAETDLAVERLQLRQKVEARFDCDSRPQSCIVSAQSGNRDMTLELQIGQAQAEIRCVLDGETQTRAMPLAHRPVLLIDNCFALHALAALQAGVIPGERCTSVPACEDLTMTSPGAESILMGGHDLGPPGVTLHLARDLDEHAWIRGDWVSRLALPRAQMRIDWQPDDAAPSHGGGSR